MKLQTTLLLENAVNFLKTCPGGMAEPWQVRESLMTNEGQALRIMKHSDFKEVIEKVEVPYRLVYPDAPRDKWQTKKKTERILEMIKLKDSNAETYNLFNKKSISDAGPGDDESSGGLLDTKNQSYDVSLLRQLYLFFVEKKGDGVKQMDVQTYFGLSRLNARGLLKVFEKYNYTDSFVVDEGRQRTKKLVLKKYSKRRLVQNTSQASQVSTTSESVLVNDTIEAEYITSDLDQDILNVTDNIVGYDAAGMDLSSVDTTITFMKNCPNLSEAKPGIRLLLQSDTMTHRTIKRCHTVLKLVQAKKIISTVILNNCVRLSEKRMGYKDLLDKKSLYRLLGRLAVDDYLNIMELSMKINDESIKYMFACDTALHKDHELIQSTVDSYKAKHVMKQVFRERGFDRDKRKDSQRQKRLEGMAPNEQNSRKILLQFTSAPKFIRMRNLHEFLFYIIYGVPKTKEPLSKAEVLSRWAATHPDIDMSKLADELPNIYSKELDWRAFVEPYNSSTSKGWGLLSDLILKMPLAVMLTLFNIEFKLPELREVMLHPVKRYLTVSQAPTSVRAMLTYRRTYAYAIYQTAVNLAYIGAIQFGQRRTIEKDHVFVYVNRNVTVYDTTSSEPAYHKITEKEYPIRVYYLNHLDHLKKYWADVYMICQETKLNSRSAEQECIIESVLAKPDLQKTLDSRSNDEVAQFDIGFLPGDKLGACGFDSALFSHLKQNWMKGKTKSQIASKILLILRTSKKKTRYIYFDFVLI